MSETVSSTNFDYDPFDHYYKGGLKDEFIENSEEYFEQLTKQAKIDLEANEELVHKIKKLNKHIAHTQKLVNKYKTIRGVCTFFSVLGFLAAVVGVFLLVMYFQFESFNTSTILLSSILCIVLGLIFGIGLIFYINLLLKLGSLTLKKT